MTITEWGKFEKLKEENEVLKKELAEKDKYIKNLENNWESVTCDNYNLQQTQLYKEDFKKIITTSYSYKGHTNIENWELKYNLKYDKLPSKDVK